MKITIIDNGSRYLPELIDYAGNDRSNEIKVLKLEELNSAGISSDLLILSGGYKDPVSLNPEKYQNEIDLVKTTATPILGICLGFEIIAYAFGCELERMHNKESKTLDLEWATSSPISESFNSVKIQEHHRWRIKNLSDEVVALAHSADGIEIIKHKQKPIYGFQFHPELNKTVSPSIFQKITAKDG